MNFDSSASASSPDPLALSPPSSPLKSRFSSPMRRKTGDASGVRNGTTTPTRRVSSPAKTITMSTGKVAGSKPWTIKVTVEAEPEDAEVNNENAYSPTIAKTPPRRGRTVKVPLRDHDNSFGKAQPRAGTPAGKKVRRASTPTRRKRRSITKVDSDEESLDDSRDQDFAPQPRSRRTRRKTSISKLIFDDEEPAEVASNIRETSKVQQLERSPSAQPDDGHTILSETDVPSPPTFSSLSPPPTTPGSDRSRRLRSSPPTNHLTNNHTQPHPAALEESPEESHHASSVSPERTAQASARPTFKFTRLAPTSSWSEYVKKTHEDQTEGEPRFQDLLSESEDEIEPTEAEVGEQTMLDSEGFSMISLESLESARDMLHRSSPPRQEASIISDRGAERPKEVRVFEASAPLGDDQPSGLLTPSSSSVHEIDVIAVNDASRPSSSPSRRGTKPATPMAAESLPPKLPALQQSTSERQKVRTPEIEKVAAATQALQSAIKTSQRPTPVAKVFTPMIVEDESLFHGFSANTRKQLRDGLQLGEQLAKQSPLRNLSQTNKSPKVAQTPDQTFTTLGTTSSPSLSIPPPPAQTEEIQYPSMSPKRSSEFEGLIRSQGGDARKMIHIPSVERPSLDSADIKAAQRPQDRDVASPMVPEFGPRKTSKPQETLASDESTPDSRPSLTLVNPHAYEPRPTKSLRRLPHDEKPLSLWQPGTSLAVLNSLRASTSSARRASSSFMRAGSASSGASSTPTPSPPPEEVNNTGDEAGSVSVRSSPSGSSSEEGSVVSDDTGMFWHHNLPGVYAKDASARPGLGSSSNLKSDKIDLSSLLKLQTPLDISPLRTPGRGLSSPRRGISAMAVLTPSHSVHALGLRGVLKTPGSPAKSKESPMKSASRVSFADFDEINAFSVDSTTESDMTADPDESVFRANETMASDVRQLHEEMGSEDSQLTADVDAETDEELDSSDVNDLSKSISEHSMQTTNASEVTNETDEEDHDSTSMTFVSSHRLESHREQTDGYSRVDATTLDGTQGNSSATAEQGLVGRFSAYVWSFVPATNTTSASQLSHPMLRDKSLSLLPRIEPWTKTHYKTLDKLYQKLKKQPDLFRPEHPDNAFLAPIIARKQRYRAGPERRVQVFSFADWTGAEMKNWGYGVTLSASHIVLAALFSQLLVLNSVAEYEELVGEKINVGSCNPGTPGDELGVDKIVFRLFSIIHGEMVRRDERKGVVIDRKRGTGWVRFKGSDQWINYM